MKFTFCLLSLFIFQIVAQAQDVQRDVLYATVDAHELRLDLYLPTQITEKKAPVVIWVHGGAWRGGSKASMPLKALINEGYAVASVDYRLSTQAVFPAQIHDIKAAIRFLRSQSAKYRLDDSRFAIAGSSAGGHLATLAGVTNEHPDLEGSVGECLEYSSSVRAIIDLYGPANLKTILEQSTAHGVQMRTPALKLLLGDLPPARLELATLASPVEHIDNNDPPLLIIHGALDPQVPMAQSDELKQAYENRQLPVEMIVIPQGKHGGEEFYDSIRMQKIKEFLAQSLQSY